jgi:hypothetical protein
MAFSVTKSRPFRSLGLYKSSGKHAAPKGYVPEPRPAVESSAHSHRPAHAATMPRLTGPQSEADRQVDLDPRAEVNATDADAADTETDTEQQTA